MTTPQITIDHDLLGEMVETDPVLIRLRKNLHTLRTQQLDRFNRRGGLKDKLKAKASELEGNRRRIFRIGKNIQDLRKQIRPLQKANLRLRPEIVRLKKKLACKIAPVVSIQNSIQRRRESLREEARIIALRKAAWSSRYDKP